MNYRNESIYTLRYNNIKDILISYGIIKEVNTENIIFTGNINIKYKFSPIFNLINNKLIGIYATNHNNYNQGLFFKSIINEFMKEYEIRDHYKYFNDNLDKNIIIINMNIEKEDINKKCIF